MWAFWNTKSLICITTVMASIATQRIFNTRLLTYLFTYFSVFLIYLLPVYLLPVKYLLIYLLIYFNFNGLRPHPPHPLFPTSREFLSERQCQNRAVGRRLYHHTLCSADVLKTPHSSDGLIVVCDGVDLVSPPWRMRRLVSPSGESP